MKNILHYGLQRSGTNFIETLLKKNFRIKIWNSNADRKHALQKHFRLYDDKTKIGDADYSNDQYFTSFGEYEQALDIDVKVDGIIIISKDPYAWYLSYLNWAEKCGWPSVNHHYIEEYNHFYGKWYEFSQQDERIVFVRYTDFLVDGAAQLSKLQETFDLPTRLLTNLFGSKTSLSKVDQSSTFSEEKFKFYTEKEYLEQIGKEKLDVINDILDVPLIKSMGYQVES
jgi:hypothetical protein